MGPTVNKAQGLIQIPSPLSKSFLQQRWMMKILNKVFGGLSNPPEPVLHGPVGGPWWPMLPSGSARNSFRFAELGFIFTLDRFQGGGEDKATSRMNGLVDHKRKLQVIHGEGEEEELEPELSSLVPGSHFSQVPVLFIVTEPRFRFAPRLHRADP